MARGARTVARTPSRSPAIAGPARRHRQSRSAPSGSPGAFGGAGMSHATRRHSGFAAAATPFGARRRRGARGPGGVVNAVTGRAAPKGARAVRSSRTLRLFFALWPVDAYRAALAAAAAAPSPRSRAGRPAGQPARDARLSRAPGMALARAVRGRRAGPLARRRSRLRAPRILGQAQGAGRDAESVPAAGLASWSGSGPASSRSATRAKPGPGGRTSRLRAGSAATAREPRLAPVESVGDEPAWRLALVDSSAHPDGPSYKPIADWPLHQGDSPFTGQRLPPSLV